MTHPLSFSASCYGFTLIEVLIAVAILSFGMLGIAAMQVVGVRANLGSYSRSQATFIASDMAERMYANPAGVQGFNYDGFTAAGTNCAAAPTRCSVDSANSSAPAACTAAQMAAYDLFVASCGQPDGSSRLGGVKDLMPNGDLSVTCAAGCTASSMRTIAVSWSERVATSTTTASSTAQSAGASAVQTQTVSLTIQP